MVEKCLECGCDLANKNREVHAFTHWNVRKEAVNSLSTEARKRYLAVLGKDAENVRGGK